MITDEDKERVRQATDVLALVSETVELRQRGKVATLALGYGGGESALTAMGALKMGIPEEDLPEIKAKWRQANPMICRLWRTVEDAAIKAVETGQKQTVQIKVYDPERARENEARTGAAPGSYSDKAVAVVKTVLFQLSGLDRIYRQECGSSAVRAF